jgi:hypothetical protein
VVSLFLTSSGILYQLEKNITSVITEEKAMLWNFFFVATGLVYDKVTNTPAYFLSQEKKFYNFDVCDQCYKTFHSRKLQVFVIS